MVFMFHLIIGLIYYGISIIMLIVLIMGLFLFVTSSAHWFSIIIKKNI